MLREYFAESCKIDGLETCIVSPEAYPALLEDAEALAEAGVSRSCVAREVRTIQQAKGFALYLAFARFSVRKNYRWFPVICWKYGNQYYHVIYRSTWLCRNCGQSLSAGILMPLCEADPSFYKGYPDIPFMFQKVPCVCCGVYLQNHLFLEDWQNK